MVLQASVDAHVTAKKITILRSEHSKPVGWKEVSSAGMYIDKAHRLMVQRSMSTRDRCTFKTLWSVFSSVSLADRSSTRWARVISRSSSTRAPTISLPCSVCQPSHLSDSVVCCVSIHGRSANPPHFDPWATSPSVSVSSLTQSFLRSLKSKEVGCVSAVMH